MSRRLLGVAGLMLVLAAPAGAAEKITVTRSDDGSGDQAAHSVSFEGSCGEECHLASLTCDATGSLEAELVDVEAKDAAKSILRDPSVLTMTIGSAKHTFYLTKFSFSEMNGSWDADARADDSDAVYKALATAKTFKLTLEKKTESLPVTEDVTAWAKACLK